MKNTENFPFEAEDFPILADPCRTSWIDRVEDARRALHEAIEIKYFYEGSSTLLIGEKTVVARAGDVIVINPYEFHATVNFGEEKGKYHLFMVEPDFFFNASPELPDVRGMLLSGKAAFITQIRGDERICGILSCVLEEMTKREEYYRSTVRGLMLELLSLLFRYGVRERVGCADSEHELRCYGIVEPALRMIRDRYAEASFTLESLAQACAVSKYYFCRVFKNATGMSAMQYLNEYRLRIAETMLENTDRSVGDIANACGFEDESYFCRCYKKQFGTTPRKWRTKGKTDPNEL